MNNYKISSQDKRLLEEIKNRFQDGNNVILSHNNKTGDIYIKNVGKPCRIEFEEEEEEEEEEEK